MNPGTGRRAGLSVLHRLKLVDQLVDYAIAKLVAHCDHQTNCQPLDDRGANVVFVAASRPRVPPDRTFV